MSRSTEVQTRNRSAEAASYRLPGTRRIVGEAILGKAEMARESLDKAEIAKRLFEAFNRRDLKSTLELVHPEIVFQPVTASLVADGQPYRGHDGLRRYLADVETYWQELTVEPQQIRCAGEAVVALGRVNGHGPLGTVEDAPTTWVLKFKDDLVVQAQIFSEPPSRKAPPNGGVEQSTAASR
jgi:ketosteroid isomerase-like protein